MVGNVSASESMVVRKVRTPAMSHTMFGDVKLEGGAHVLILRRQLSNYCYGIVLDGHSAGQAGLFLADACCREGREGHEAETTQSYMRRAASVLGVEVG